MARYAATGVSAALTTTYKTALNTFTTTGARPRIERMDFGFGAAPADTTVYIRASRTSAVGTEGAGVVPAPLDPADPASLVDCGEAHSAEPTYTAATEFLELPLNQRAAFSWMAAPGGEIVIPATTAAGVGQSGKGAAYTGVMDASVIFNQ